MNLKVCGMRYDHNILEIASVKPDYMGFIFYEGSARHMTSSIPTLSTSIKKVGVFVNASFDFIVDKKLPNLKLLSQNNTKVSKYFDIQVSVSDQNITKSDYISFLLPNGDRIIDKEF